MANLEHGRVNTCSLYASPAGLSPYLRFGCLSCRVLYYNLRELFMKVPGPLADRGLGHVLTLSGPQLRKGCSPPPSLFGQLLWREFFYTAATNNPNFDRMEGNPICVQVGRRPSCRPPASGFGPDPSGPPVSRSPGTRTRRLWPSGLRVRRAFPGSTPS